MWHSRHRDNPFYLVHKQSNVAALLITTKEVVFQNVAATDSLNAHKAN